MRALVGLALGLTLLSGGCVSATQGGQSTALDGWDLQRMTDEMAMRIAAAPEVQRAIARAGSLRVVVQPVENHLQAEVLPAGPATAFTARLRGLLSRHNPDSFIWIMNRDAFYALRGRELDGAVVDLGPSPEAVNPEYALVARFYSMTDEDRERRQAYYLCVFELTSLADRSVLWSGRYEVKKVAVRGMLG